MKSGNEIGVYIDRTYKVVRQDLINRFKRASIDLTPEQWVIISKFETLEEMSQKELGDLSFKDRPTVSRIVDLLVKKDLISRMIDGDDRRKTIIRLTEKGRGIILEAKPYVLASREIGWEGLSEIEYQRLIQILDKIFENYTA